MKKIKNSINLFFLKLVAEKNTKKRKVIYAVSMGLSLLGIVLALFTPLCKLDVDGTTYNLTAINWIFNTKDVPELKKFLMIQVLSFMFIMIALIANISLIVFGKKKNEDSVIKCSERVSMISFVVVSLYMIFTWFFPIISYQEGLHEDVVNVNYFLGAYIILFKILYALFLDKLKKFRKADIIQLDDTTIKVIIEKKYRFFRRRGLSQSSGESNNVDYNKKTEINGCPIFTEIDNKAILFESELKDRKSKSFKEPSLKKIVDFIVQYARDSRLHLYYTHEDIATFIAGLGTCNLTILQGMSGTGKTSLPKIVAEALNSNCDIVEVESSWRDKNELLGYYNEFSKIYTPKKFTQALYKAKLNSEVISFIVLDEMNLSRIEYYFSDFLSLMENEPGKREIRLVNVKLKKNDLDQTKYYGLEEGHTLRIPNNVWFIGTANRDESTYDISDKVYDRANTMNFDKRAKKTEYFSEPLDNQYLSPAVLLELFEKAKSEINFTIDNNSVIEEVEKILEPYNISFGNRIALQIETFVKIYSSCFELVEQAKNDALEIILLSKVVRKLELKNIEDKEELAAKFANLNLFRCSNFIQSLKED